MRQLIRLYSTPLVLLIWALLLWAVGNSLVLTTIGLVATAMAVTIQVRELNHEYKYKRNNAAKS